MIIVQTPLRISFFGGGTDFPSFYLSEGGCALSTAIDKYIFVTIKERFDDKLRVGYTKTEIVDRVDEIQHELIREALRMTGIEKSVEITTMSDIPAGSGLGSSSAVTVGSLHAMSVHQGLSTPVATIAEQACKIEIEVLGKPIGVQDQYITAYGGLRFFQFTTSGQVLNEKVLLTATEKRRFNENLLVFYTGMTRQAQSILEEQKNNIKGRLAILREMKQMTHLAYEEICKGNLDSFGHLLHESWLLKKQLASKISNGPIDEWYQKARAAGALGGKITGAGGGGFLLFYCPYERREPVRDALSHLREMPVGLEPDGAKVIFDYRR